MAYGGMFCNMLKSLKSPSEIHPMMVVVGGLLGVVGGISMQKQMSLLMKNLLSIGIDNVYAQYFHLRNQL